MFRRQGGVSCSCARGRERSINLNLGKGTVHCSLFHICGGGAWQVVYNKSMAVLLYIFGAVLIVSLISLVGAVYLVFSRTILDRSTPWLVAFAAGTILGVVFFDLIPESMQKLGDQTFIFVVVGILAFLLFEQVLHWHHHREQEECKECPQTLPVGYSVLLVDGVHNFLDGVLITSAFLLDIRVGITATVAVLLHEVPQEIGDFAVLIHSGFKKKKALSLNFLSALAAVVGAAIAYLALNEVKTYIPYTVAFGAGGFLYIALVDLLSDFKGGKSLSLRLAQLVMVVMGVALMAWL